MEHKMIVAQVHKAATSPGMIILATKEHGTFRSASAADKRGADDARYLFDALVNHLPATTYEALLALMEEEKRAEFG